MASKLIRPGMCRLPGAKRNNKPLWVSLRKLFGWLEHKLPSKVYVEAGESDKTALWVSRETYHGE